jgi:hypothetical protein
MCFEFQHGLVDIRKFYYLNESYQVSCLSHNANINVFGIFMCLTQLQFLFTCFYFFHTFISFYLSCTCCIEIKSSIIDDFFFKFKVIINSNSHLRVHPKEYISFGKGVSMSFVNFLVLIPYFSV